jgi:hypothetical protein
LGPWLQNSGSAYESLTLCGSQQVDLELRSENGAARFGECRSSPTGSVIGHGRLNACVNEAVLLQVPGFDVECCLAEPRLDRDQTNAQARDKRGGIEYTLQFLAWHFVETFHFLSTCR